MSAELLERLGAMRVESLDIANQAYVLDEEASGKFYDVVYKAIGHLCQALEEGARREAGG